MPTMNKISGIAVHSSNHLRNLEIVMDDESLKRQLDLDVENLSLNQLNNLGNQAVSMGLIAGHGYHKGQYEIIRHGKILTLSAQKAFDYLQELIQSVSQ
jgi:hypothetical protein